MRKHLQWVIALGLVLLTPVPASATHGTDDYIGKTWLSGQLVRACIEDFQGPLTAAEYTNMRQTVNHMFQDQLLGNTDVFGTWILNDGQCATNLTFQNWTCGEIEATYPNITPIRISYDDVGSSSHGESFICDFAGDTGGIDFAWISICPPTGSSCANTGGDWHWAWDQQGSVGSMDFPSIFLHELIHGVGFKDHFPNTSDACPHDGSGIPPGGQSVMCSLTDGIYQARDQGSGHQCCVWRTLGTHDVGEINQAYN